jgi:hypothetical protein
VKEAAERAAKEREAREAGERAGKEAAERERAAEWAAARAHSPKCVVPRLNGDSLTEARRALGRAHCRLGKLTEPVTTEDRWSSSGKAPAAAAGWQRAREWRSHSATPRSDKASSQRSPRRLIALGAFFGQLSMGDTGLEPVTSALSNRLGA